MSLTSGGTAPKPLSSGGSTDASAGSGGMVAVFAAWKRPPSRHQVQIEASRLLVSTTTPTKPYSRVGSWAGRRAHSERHLVVRAEVHGLQVTTAAQIPEMELVPIAVAEQVVGDDAVLELRR